MSIWSSESVVTVRSYATGWSNHYPTKTGHVERKAELMFATIPDYCVPGHREEWGEAIGPWLRMCVYSHAHDFNAPRKILGPEDASVVMDEEAVQALVDELQQWLARPKAHPIKAKP